MDFCALNEGSFYFIDNSGHRLFSMALIDAVKTNSYHHHISEIKEQI